MVFVPGILIIVLPSILETRGQFCCISIVSRKRVLTLGLYPHLRPAAAPRSRWLCWRGRKQQVVPDSPTPLLLELNAAFGAPKPQASAPQAPSVRTAAGAPPPTASGRSSRKTERGGECLAPAYVRACSCACSFVCICVFVCRLSLALVLLTLPERLSPPPPVPRCVAGVQGPWEWRGG